MSQLTLILDNIRSSHNVGAILRTCDATGISMIFACGTTPYPRQKDDQRDPVAANRNSREIAKTALGAEQTVAVSYRLAAAEAVAELTAGGWHVYGLEQAPQSLDLFSFEPSFPAALVLGSETSGIGPEALNACEAVLEIPQLGRKESLNVSVAAGIAVYNFRRQTAVWPRPDAAASRRPLSGPSRPPN